MKLALIGYGKMGKEIAKCALLKGFEVTAIIDRSSPDATSKHLSSNVLAEIDVCLDFSHPHSLLQNVQLVAQAGKALVIGTTGWDEQLLSVKKIVKDYQIGVIYGSNFSLGMHLFFSIVSHAAHLIAPYPEYDVAGWELHHGQKVDTPSGTAKTLAMEILKRMPRKQSVIYESIDQPLAPHEMQFSSLRSGQFPGTHTVLFDSLNDTIELQHTVRSRSGLAQGALSAAEWIKDRTGFFSIEEMISNI